MHAATRADLDISSFLRHLLQENAGAVASIAFSGCFLASRLGSAPGCKMVQQCFVLKIWPFSHVFPIQGKPCWSASLCHEPSHVKLSGWWYWTEKVQTMNMLAPCCRNGRVVRFCKNLLSWDNLPKPSAQWIPLELPDKDAFQICWGWCLKRQGNEWWFSKIEEVE